MRVSLPVSVSVSVRLSVLQRDRRLRQSPVALAAEIAAAAIVVLLVRRSQPRAEELLAQDQPQADLRWVSTGFVCYSDTIYSDSWLE